MRCGEKLTCHMAWFNSVRGEVAGGGACAGRLCVCVRRRSASKLSSISFPVRSRLACRRALVLRQTSAAFLPSDFPCFPFTVFGSRGVVLVSLPGTTRGRSALVAQCLPLLLRQIPRQILRHVGRNL